VGSLYYLVLFDRIIQFLPLFAAMLLLFAGALAFALNKLKRRLVMFSRGQLEIQDVEVTSLVDGENLPASLFTCRSAWRWALHFLPSFESSARTMCTCSAVTVMPVIALR
jgi:hypothetical protein